MAAALVVPVLLPGGAASAAGTALSGTAEVTLQLVAYSGTAPAGPVTSLTGASHTGGTAHTTPSATAPAGSWVLSVWSDKSSAARQFSAPAGVVERSNTAGVGSGDVATLLADGGGPVTGGQAGGLTATVPVAISRATMLTVLLAPA